MGDFAIEFRPKRLTSNNSPLPPCDPGGPSRVSAMFKRRNGPTQKEQMHIGQPQLLHTTYDQNLMPKWSGLVASNAPSERLDESLETGSVFRPGRDQSGSPPFLDENSGDFSTSSSNSQLPPHPLRSHLRTQSELPSIPSSQTSVNSVQSKAHSKSRKTSASISSHIPLFQNQLARARKSPDPSEAEYSADSLGASGQTRGPGGSMTWDEQQLNSDPRYQVSVAVSPANQRIGKAKKGSWTERAARIRKDTFDSRPPWKGGSGRSALVDPVSDTSVPRTASRYTAVRDMPRGRMNESESDNSLGVASSRSGGRDMSPVSMMGGRYEEDYDTIARNDSTLDYEDKDVSPLVTPSSATPSIKDLPWTSSRPVTRKPVGLRNASSGGHSSLILEREEEDDTPYVKPNQGAVSSANKDKILPPLLPIPSDNSTVSRFSWTTVNTVTTSQLDSPPPSPHVPSVPPLPLYQENARSGHGSFAKPPTPPLVDSEGDAVEKALPKAPMASQSMSHVEALAAQEAELTMRRRNIQRIIQELLQVENASPLEIDWKTSKAIKKKLEERREQLADVEREQHELGLAIARARRKADREDGIESGLWVRRITG
ncbi:hypothetical protein K461DRAFT_282628 [Myriangium duriaei CBS 260.36]|uniref:Uncharacterized protein n=1 Tax=Myriangium duriaei CBS 260.36 TaxID=1168546 RepID=A0A9P4IQH1_9PEZI|nr:hypothetical protein K461DRAFT_282628 [Myriangium duriaei CBS 260.36]